MSDLQKVPTGSGHSLQERTSRRQWILGRVATLLSHYWREDDPSELTEAIARDWADILEGMPQDAIHAACLRYMRDEPRRKPTPGAIYALARDAIPKPRIIHRAPPPVEDATPRCTAEQAAQIMEKAGFRAKRFGGTSDE